MKCGPTRKTSDEEEEEEEEKKKEDNCGDTHTALKGEEQQAMCSLLEESVVMTDWLVAD